MRHILLLVLFFLTACNALPQPTPTPAPTATPAPTLGAGFRYSTYGPAYNPGPAYWLSVGQRMAAKFPNATPETIWIVGNYGITGPVFTFPGSDEDFKIHFMAPDQNEEALTLFDQAGVRVWLQVEPGEADMVKLIRIMLDQYGHHPSVVGVGVDVEWFHSDGTPEGRQVTDEEAQAWVEAVRSYNPAYRVFLKHWETGKMPPTYRDGLLFVDDSQQFESFDHMIEEFAVWGEFFAPAPVAFQYGYLSDEKWWRELADPPGDIGKEILAHVPNTAGLFWVDFTALQLFPTQE